MSMSEMWPRSNNPQGITLLGIGDGTTEGWKKGVAINKKWWGTYKFM